MRPVPNFSELHLTCPYLRPSFVDAHCQRLRQTIGFKRKRGPTALKILGPAALWVFRNLRVRTFG